MGEVGTAGCELYSEALIDHDLSAHVSSLRMFVSAEPSRDPHGAPTVVVTPHLEPVREGFEVAAMTIPTEVADLTPLVRARLVLDSIGVLMTALAAARGWPGSRVRVELHDVRTQELGELGHRAVAAPRRRPPRVDPRPDARPDSRGRSRTDGAPGRHGRPARGAAPLRARSPVAVALPDQSELDLHVHEDAEEELPLDLASLRGVLPPEILAILEAQQAAEDDAEDED